MIIIALLEGIFANYFEKKIAEKFSKSAFIQIEILACKILAGDVNSGKSLDAMLMSSKDRSANNRHKDCHTFCNCFCDP